MALFQKSVLKKYLNTLDNETVEEAFQIFQEKYSEIKILEIQRLKEEEYQSGFLNDIFVGVLGYTLKPENDYNLALEFKNKSDSKKADGAILNDGNAIAVIELKSTKTKNFKKIELQAFNYKNNQPDCKYVITSNFHKLRFYIENSTEHEEFDLFRLGSNKEAFKLFFLILNKENLLADIPLKLKKDSIHREENISKEFYKDYSAFKAKLFSNLVVNNQQHDKLILFKKTQKLIDRFLFILFAEDRGLVPPNLINTIIERYHRLKEDDAYKPLYDIYKQYFSYMNVGSKKFNIHEYNGGLFYTDLILNELIIDEGVLIDDLQNLSKYDFTTDVDVNILGKIFEHSLAEIEAITAEIEGKVLSKTKSKRKKDGIFYTPKYITKYIVEQTIGKLCDEKKFALDLLDIEVEGKTITQEGKLYSKYKSLSKNIIIYQEWLLSLKIVDPACGSGAFLNQALEFLIAEHEYIIQVQTDLKQGQVSLFNIETVVIENNLYGVDINEESVEIAKLSLWLRTAKKGRKLSVLSNNIKCGDSLIDDPEVAGDKAFNWQQEFSDVFERGGFDVVIGNPPYGAELLEEQKIFLERHYDTFEYQVNTYVLFYEQGLKITKDGGMVGYITPATFTYQHYFSKLRHFLQRYKQVAISKYSYEVFDDADIGDSVSWITHKTKNDKTDILVQVCTKQEDSNLQPKLRNYESIVHADTTYMLSGVGINIPKLYENSELLTDIARVTVGVKSYQKGKGKPKQTADTVRTKPFTSTSKIDESYIQCVNGKDFHRYGFLREPSMYVSYGEWLAEPRIKAPFSDEEKIILRQTADSLIGHIDNKKRINLNNVYNIGQKNSNFKLKYILGILNSSLLNVIYQNISQEKGRTFAEVKKVFLAKLPIKIADDNTQHKIIQLVELLIDTNEQFQKKKSTFINRVVGNLAFDKKNNSLKTFFDNDFTSFIGKLKKEKIELSLIQQDEWEKYFTIYKDEINNLQKEIVTADKHLNQAIYSLYGLSEDEILLIENIQH